MEIFSIKSSPRKLRFPLIIHTLTDACSGEVLRLHILFKVVLLMKIIPHNYPYDETSV